MNNWRPSLKIIGTCSARFGLFMVMKTGSLCDLSLFFFLFFFKFEKLNMLPSLWVRCMGERTIYQDRRLLFHIFFSFNLTDVACSPSLWHWKAKEVELPCVKTWSIEAFHMRWLCGCLTAKRSLCVLASKHATLIRLSLLCTWGKRAAKLLFCL